MPDRGNIELSPISRNELFLSLVIPAYNESQNIWVSLRRLSDLLREEAIPFEVVVVNDNSEDDTADVVEQVQKKYAEVRLVHNSAARGLGRAVRCGLQHVRGDAVAIVMADLSDSPEDVAACYRKLEEGYDCVYGSRFLPGSTVSDYPPLKLAIQRTVNQLIRLMFLTRHNDMTNAFKMYRRHVIEAIQPLQASHFNITIEMSLSALIRHFRIATIPISWYGRNWGSSNLKLRAMGRRYLATLLKIWFERLLILDDVLVESESRGLEGSKSVYTEVNEAEPRARAE